MVSIYNGYYVGKFKLLILFGSIVVCLVVIYVLHCNLNIMPISCTVACISVCCFACTELYQTASECK